MKNLTSDELSCERSTGERGSSRYAPITIPWLSSMIGWLVTESSNLTVSESCMRNWGVQNFTMVHKTYLLYWSFVPCILSYLMTRSHDNRPFTSINQNGSTHTISNDHALINIFYVDGWDFTLVLWKSDNTSFQIRNRDIHHLFSGFWKRKIAILNSSKFDRITINQVGGYRTCCDVS